MEKLKNITKKEEREIEDAIFEDGNVSFNRNDLSLVTSFFQRAKQIHASAIDNFPEGFDLYQNKLAYGKVDTKNRVIFPNEKKLVKIGKRFTDETHFLNETTYELYLKFYSETREEIALNIKSMNEFANVYQIESASPAPAQIVANYKEKLKMQIKDAFIEFVAPDHTSMKDDAKDFDRYMELVVKMVQNGHLKEDVLFSEFVVGLDNSILNTGLAFEIANQTPYDDDEQKFADYYNKPSYQEIAIRLLKCGLRYDRHAPWRFILDLNAPAVAKMTNGQSKQEFFDENYFEIDGTFIEMSLFFEVVFLSYLELFEEAPFYFTSQQELVTCTGRQQKKSTSRALRRKSISTAEFLNKFNTNFPNFFQKYAHVLNTLYNNGNNSQALMLFISSLTKKQLDKETLVRYTYNKIKHC